MYPGTEFSVPALAPCRAALALRAGPGLHPHAWPERCRIGSGHRAEITFRLMSSIPLWCKVCSGRDSAEPTGPLQRTATPKPGEAGRSERRPRVLAQRTRPETGVSESATRARGLFPGTRSRAALSPPRFVAAAAPTTRFAPALRVPRSQRLPPA